MADEVQALERSVHRGPRGAELIGRHFPAEHRAAIVERVAVRRHRRCADLRHDRTRESRHDVVEAADDLPFDLLFVRAPIPDGVEINRRQLLDDDDMAARRRHRGFVQRRHEDLERTRRDVLAVP